MSVRKGYVEVEPGQVHYRYGGDEADPTIVLFHQNGSSSVSFHEVMGRLESDYHVVAPDTPGFGQSFQPDEVPDISYYSSVLLEALDRLGIRTFHLLGHHTGVCMSVDLAAEYPDRARSVMLIGPLDITEEERREYRSIYTGETEGKKPDPEGRYLDKLWDYLVDHGAAESLDVLHQELIAHLRSWRGRAQTYGVVWDFAYSEQFARIDAPRLLMAAEDDVLWPMFERARDRYPAADTAVLEGGSFEPDLDPEGLNAAVRNFLDRHF